MKKVRIFDNTFTGFTRSASLREENKDVSPTHFEWVAEGISDGVEFYTDGELKAACDIHEYVVPHAKKIAWLIEPRCLRPENYRFIETCQTKYENDALFDVVLTYDQRLLDAIPNARFYPLGGSSIAFSKWGIYPKTRDICMFYSGKDTTEGHKLRKQIVEEFGDRIDVYGAGVGRPVDSKFEVLKDYRFCVVVESCFEMGYFTEKLIDCFSVNTIPIYCGLFSSSWKLGKLGFGQVMRFLSVNGLAVKLDALENLGIEFSWHNDEGKFANFYNATNYRICENWIFNNYPDLFED